MAISEVVTVRPARREDTRIIARLADGLRSDIGDPTGHLTADLIERDGFGERPEFEVLVAEARDGGLVGYALFYNA